MVGSTSIRVLIDFDGVQTVPKASCVLVEASSAPGSNNDSHFFQYYFSSIESARAATTLFAFCFTSQNLWQATTTTNHLIHPGIAPPLATMSSSSSSFRRRKHCFKLKLMMDGTPFYCTTSANEGFQRGDAIPTGGRLVLVEGVLPPTDLVSEKDLIWVRLVDGEAPGEY